MSRKRLNTERIKSFWRSRVSPDGNYYCEWCKRQVSRIVPEAAKNRATIDHVIATALGGDNKAENLVVSCRDCNRKKSNHEYATVQKLNSLGIKLCLN